jgi:hypothetical protein
MIFYIFIFRYENELRQARWSSVRKGAVFGVLMGWLSLLRYIVYPVVFIFGAISMSHEDRNRLTINDILAVSDSYRRTTKKLMNIYCFQTDRFSFCTVSKIYWFHWYLLSIIFRGSSCSSTSVSTDWWGKFETFHRQRYTIFIYMA